MTLWPDCQRVPLKQDVKVVKQRRKGKKRKQKEDATEQYIKISRMRNRNAHNLYENVYERKDYWRMLNKICRGIRHFD